jgi:hypothetical protein
LADEWSYMPEWKFLFCLRNPAIHWPLKWSEFPWPSWCSDGQWSSKCDILKYFSRWEI